ncbi:hypothetical protein Tco_1091099 [Tanacetum coccineum]|uniref:Uncharacterized protein n=1 Tax=Tanacetum coccineum TaxID=301880 RepID=A0ABQ5I623_9ASTR
MVHSTKCLCHTIQLELDWILESTAGPSNVSDAGPSTSTAGDIFKDEMTTIVDTLVAIRSARPRTTSVKIHNVAEEPRRATPVPTVQSQDKAKGMMVEHEPTPKNPRKAHIQMDEELAQRMDADELLAERLQQKEREQFTIDEQARILVDLIAERKKFFVAQRAEQIRNKPSKTEQDVIDIYRLVKERYETTSPEGYDLLLWGDLKNLLEPSEEDKIWKNQQDYNLISWRLFNSCGVHVLLMDTGIAIHMMVENTYPLTQEMLSRMLNRRLEVDHESEMAFKLLSCMKKVIKGEFEKIKDIKVEYVSLTCDTPLEVFNNEVNRLSEMDDDLFTYEVEISNIPCDSKMDDDLEHEADDDMGYDPSDVAFTEGDDEVELTDEESSDDKDEVTEVFRIDTNLFNFETPMYKAFREFNYLLQIDPDLLTKDIEGFKTYEDYKDDWIYEWNKDVPWVDEKPWTYIGVWTKHTPVKHTCKPFNYKTGCSEWPTCNWMDDGYCNGGNLPKTYIIRNQLHYQDNERYKALEDSKLKDEALRNKAIMEGLIKR